MLYNNQKVKTPRYVVELARELRRNLTASEKLLWGRLKKDRLHGLRFRCQHPVYQYILDFYCHDAGLAVEIDGEIHKERLEYDKYRDEFLEAVGIVTLRFAVDDVMLKTDEVISLILKVLQERSGQ